MKYFVYVNGFLLSINPGLAFLLASIGAASFLILLLSIWGKSKMGMSICLPIYIAGAVGFLSIMSRLIEA